MHRPGPWQQHEISRRLTLSSGGYCALPDFYSNNHGIVPGEAGSGLALALSLAARAHRQGRYIPAGGSKERAARSPFWRGGCTDAIMRPRTTATRKRRPAANRREIVEDRGVSTATSPDLPQLLPKKVVIAVSGRRTTSISASTHARLTGSSSQQNRKPYPAPAMHHIRRN